MKKFILVCIFLLSGLGVYAGFIVRNDILTCNPYTMENDFAHSVGEEGLNGGLEFLNSCINKYPDVPQFYNNRANIYKVLKNYDAAIADYNKAIELDENYISPKHGKITLALVQGNYNGQLEKINDLITQNPNSYILYNTRAVIKFHNNDFQGAVDDLTKCLSLNTDYKEGYKTRGYAYAGLKDYNNCVKDLTTYITYQANDADVWYHRALCYSQLPDKSFQMLSDLVIAAKLYHFYGDQYQYEKIKELLNSAGFKY